MAGRGRIWRWFSTPILAVGIVACAAARQKSPALAPMHGRGVLTADVRQGSSDLTGDSGGSLLAEPAQDRTCVDFWPEVRFRNYGYDHIVHLLSRCDVRASCVVSSDVNPKATVVEVGPGEHVEVLTFRGSPAREFTPRVECRIRA